MAHPHNESRAHKVERARVGRMTEGYADHGNAESKVKHYATGGAVKKPVQNKATGGEVSGEKPAHRADRRARGGKVKGKKGNTTVNVVVGHHGTPAGGPPPMVAAPQAALPPRPMAPPIPPAGGPPMAAPPGGAPPMPLRAKGGRIGRDRGGSAIDWSDKDLRGQSEMTGTVKSVPAGTRAINRAKGGGVMKGVDDGGDNGADRYVSGKGKTLGGIMTASLGSKDVADRTEAAQERNYGRKKGGRVQRADGGGTTFRGKRHYGDDRDTTTEHPAQPATNDPNDYSAESYRAPIGQKSGGGVKRASGGGVNGLYPTSKGTSVWRESVMDGTPVQHSGNKSDGQSIGRDKVITYKTGGAVEHAVKGQMGPKYEGGAGGGEARLQKAHKRHNAVKAVHANATGK